MEIKHQVDLETLTEEEIYQIESGEKTEEDFIAEYKSKSEATLEELREKARKNEELATNYKIRAEKAEKSKGEHHESTPTNDSIPQKDLIALLKANVEEEDIQEVLDYSKLKNISVSEALKSSVVKSILSEKNEERQTASITATGNIRKGVNKPTGSALLERASKGEMPESDEDMAALVRARLDRNK